MTSEAPPFWWEKPDWRVLALSPLSAAYGLVAGRRMRRAPREKMAAPVLCVGNLTVGGSGKTPVAIALAKQAKRMRLTPGFLSRGHGGSFSKPHVVDAHHDAAKHVGDEPLLLAEHAPVAVTPNRAAGARLLMEQHGCDFLIMDDGFQSARIHIDYALVVVDARFGIGNGRVIPGGPLRAKVVDQLVFTSGLLKMGEGSAADGVVRQAARAGRPIFLALVEPANPGHFAGGRFLAFAGIGHPEKFFDTVRGAGGEVVLSRAFPDHHVYAADELADLATLAKREGLRLVTTAKDAARLRHGTPANFLDQLDVLEIDAVFELDHVPERIINETLDAWRQRKMRG
ncbi:MULTISPECIES: tetraacyldisaccharide 4'-kinase [unclassified Mesorhizobium]|uniref:tetraacyldisaccharide 4'-kinase n=3 Tax=Mesorhizobium TaxID=68287 RepID=UPI000BAEEACD|nr:MULTISPECIES: tetraacyldisaccharide 4'-kinase [unclassified Mesorhizobium]TGT53620.1 tetraacyldisaccharide 4'-kinase [Mesorhizobium sp. M00.F.Ca.ET.170.01.1.1]AZO08443.1 tetraacyldisaccharide 4'-kinase [Mesorhizobium sp. M3A.F.Ca.ET.080.04.2.1]PBB83849.1 tetraacyldisaccharide 4'-kinase [Mesorhizobium sp. WSM3876]RWB67790.1 MAG: tetraacyldisaccharide 4'-kinase [Mesorhizobium sp.]RWB81947.1 MAG: tetraacyldisaccharide 4'-kinase [Mesorhizobium sp.]